MAVLIRLAVYLILFVVLLSLLATLTDFWQDIDFAVYRNFYLEDSDSIELTDDIILIDIPHKAKGKENENYDRGNFRLRLANLLDTIGVRKDHPEAVLLDFYFQNEPQELDTLIYSLKNLEDKPFNVYGVYDMRFYKDISFEENEELLVQEIYEYYLDGFKLHTMFEEKRGVLFYKSELKFPRENNAGYEIIEALVSRVARDLATGGSPILEPREYVLPLGNKKSIEDQTYQFTHPGNSTKGGKFSGYFNMKEKVLIVGSFKADYLDKIDKTGTHLVAWALNDQLKKIPLAKQPLNHPVVIISLILFFAFFTVLIFALLFKFVKLLQTKPLVIAILSFVIGMALLWAFGAVILTIANKVTPVGLTLMGMALAAILAWRYAYKFLVTGIAEGSQKYDVFISYSHGNSDWVVKNVYEPLKAMRTPDGDKLSIFFDSKSIGIGEAFTAKYMWGIVDSRFFIPIISKEYYGKNHCKNEMDLAYKRSVEKLLHILPIAFSYEAVPQIYTHINFSDITVNPNFIEDIKKELSGAKEP